MSDAPIGCQDPPSDFGIRLMESEKVIFFPKPLLPCHQSANWEMLMPLFNYAL